MYWIKYPRQLRTRSISCLKETKSQVLGTTSSGSTSTDNIPQDTKKNYNSMATKSVQAKTIPPTASGMLCPTVVAPTLLFVVEVEADPAPELVSDPVCPAAGEEVVFAVVPFEV